MKKLLFSLASLGIISSTSTMAVSCSSFLKAYPGDKDCFDENWKNWTTKNSPKEQWDDYLAMMLGMYMLPKQIFSHSEDFYNKLNGKNSSELFEYFAKLPDDEKWEDSFSTSFTFLITFCDSINSKVVDEMKNTISKETKPGTYLILNLPHQNASEISKASEIDFQFIYLVKNPDNVITSRSPNNWFYWYDFQALNGGKWDHQYFFNLSNTIDYKRVVTNYF